MLQCSSPHHCWGLELGSRPEQAQNFRWLKTGKLRKGTGTTPKTLRGSQGQKQPYVNVKTKWALRVKDELLDQELAGHGGPKWAQACCSCNLHQCKYLTFSLVLEMLKILRSTLEHSWGILRDRASTSTSVVRLICKAAA
jgi:hypothetical protein